MAEEKLAAHKGAASEAKRRHPAGPLAEAHMKDCDRYPIWVSIRDAGHVRAVFGFLREELIRAGFNCDGDLQTEPHDGLKIESFFELFLQVDQKRAPENLGMVTLYSDAQGNLAIKMNPHFPEACDDFRTALSLALERQLGALGGGGKVNIDIVIRQQSDYEPIPPVPQAEPPKPA